MTVEPSPITKRPNEVALGVDSEPSSVVVGQLVSLRVLLSALRRGRRLWLSTMVLGLVAGVAAFFALPAHYSATTTLLLQHNGAGDQAQAMATDVALLQTEGVAQPVVTRLRLHVSAQQLLTQYSGTSVSTQVLQVTVNAPTAFEARRRADAVASSFLTFRSQQYNRANQVVVAALQGQLDDLTRQVTKLNATLSGLSPSGSASASSGTGPVATLQAERNQDITQQAQLRQTIQNDNLNTTAAVEASGVLSPATANHHSRVKPLITDGVTGLLVGLMLGVGVVALWAALSERVRRREDVAVALGAPVELNLDRFPRPRWNAVRRLRSRVERPRADTVVMARHLRAKMGSGQGNLAVVSVDSVEASALAVACCARELTRDGREVLVVDLTETSILSKLLGVPAPKATKKPLSPADDDATGVRVFGPSTNGWVDTRPPLGGHVLVLATLDPTVGAEDLLPWAQDAVVVVTAGRTGVEKIRANAELLRAAGVRLDSAVLIDADRHDYSLGRRSWASWPKADRRFLGVPVSPVTTTHQSS